MLLMFDQSVSALNVYTPTFDWLNTLKGLHVQSKQLATVELHNC